ncbi:MAG: 50S ribosomal protein L31e [Candidatus Methanofastidiosia archaeon]
MKVGEERIYVVPLRKSKKAPRGKRASRAARELREFLSKHTKTPQENVIISKELNERLWERGIQKPPPRVRVKVEKVEEEEIELVRASLVE